ncbi:MAG: TPM domain-containing protein [Haliscomenobacter sp.]|nr:TPM domain-containing protein [Haliscomenobacter sp.]
MLLALLCFPALIFSKEVPPRPNTLVNDYAGILDQGQKTALEQKLVAYADSTSTQIAIVLESSLDGDDVFEYSFRLAEAWGIGSKGNDNGILIYAALEDRKLYIHAGPGVQGYLTDNVSKRILDQIIRPAFREGAYYVGLDKATTVMIELGAGTYSNEASGKEGNRAGSVLLVLLIVVGVIFLFSLFSNTNDGDGGGYYRGGHYDAGPHGRRGGGGWIIFPGGGGWGSGGSGGGNNDSGGWGDFGGFGGGGFDGGGAGGDW